MSKGLFDLSGKVAVVTGGNGGLGLAFARGLAKQGASIALWGRSEEKNRAALAEIEGLGVPAIAQRIDVEDERQVVDGFAETMDRLHRIDTVIANAGVSGMKPTIEMTSEVWHNLLAVNLHGAFYTLREGAKHMVARAEAGEKGGSLIVCGSGAVFGGVGGTAHYSASKSGLVGVVRVMATELGPHGIRVNMIAPGLIKTDIIKEARQLLDVVSARAPLRRPGEPEDLEGVAAYLASDAARYHTGDVLNVDGGWYASYF